MTAGKGFGWIDSGGDLRAELQPAAHMLGNILELARQDGTITPDKPANADRVKDLLLKNGYEVKSDVEIRALVNFLRRIKRPIGSNGKGYFWALNGRELTDTLEQLDSRIKGILAARNGLATAFDAEGQGQLI
jgi:hypothetical protein